LFAQKPNIFGAFYNGINAVAGDERFSHNTFQKLLIFWI